MTPWFGKGACKWTQDDIDEGWDTECGGKFILETGSPHENKFAFCPYCGRYLAVQGKDVPHGINS